MKLKIAMIAPIEERVPPEKYGGTELVIYNLTEELVRLGHSVDLYAAGTSKTSGNLIPIFEKPVRKIPKLINDQKARQATRLIAVTKVLEHIGRKKYDIIHNHIDWHLIPFANILNAPIISTFHGPLDSPIQFVYDMFAREAYVSISDSQRRPMKNLNFVATVYNGIQIEKFHFDREPEDYLAFLGRMSPEKGPIQAIKIARAARRRLIMAAKIDPYDRPYFEKEIKPLIDGKKIKYIGEIGHPEKVKLLRKASALLAPIQWEEPFGLFMTEAMACGTPVIAFKRGSVPEIVKDNKTGFVVKTVAQAAAAVKKLNTIKRSDCRRDVEKRFSAQVMAKNYAAAYLKVINKK